MQWKRNARSVTTKTKYFLNLMKDTTMQVDGTKLLDAYCEITASLSKEENDIE